MTDEAGLANYQRRLRELSDGYLLRTSDGLQQACARLAQAREGDTTALQAIILIVHRASGSGGMLGFPQISQLAGLLELQLRSASDVPISTAGWHEVEQQLRCLQDAVGAAQQARHAAQPS